MFLFLFSPPPATRQNQMKLSTMTEYILKLCTRVLVLSCDQDWGRTTWSKIRNFNTIWSLLFRDRTPQLRGRIEWNFLQWKNIYWSCAHRYWFCCATKIEVVRLGQNWGISTQFGVCYSATELHNYGAESNATFYNERIYIEVVHLGICFVVRPNLGSYDLVKMSADRKSVV